MTNINYAISDLIFPIILLVISFFLTTWLILEFFKRRTSNSFRFFWLSINILSILVLIYIILVISLSLNNIKLINIFNWISNKLFGWIIQTNHQWIILFFLFFINLLFVTSFTNKIKISQNEDEIKQLNRQLAIILGMINNSNDSKKLPKVLFEDVFINEKEKNKKEIKIAKLKLKHSKKKAKINNKINKQNNK